MADTKNDPKQNEPQSYGSQGEWVTGKTGEKVNDPKSAPPNSQHGDFYESRRDAEHNNTAIDQGGLTSPVQLADNAAAAPPPVQAIERDEQPIKGVNTNESGAPRGSWFKNRDYST